MIDFIKRRALSSSKIWRATAVLATLSLIYAIAGVYATVQAATPASLPMNVYYGTTHTHTGAHNDHGGDNSGAPDIFAAAKANNFNFVFLTEHSGPTGPQDATAYYAGAKATAAAASVNGSFIGFAGYEYSENGSDGDNDKGHMTGYGTELFTNASARGMKFSTFMDYLASQSRQWPAFGGFNHPPASGHPASATSLLTPARRSAMVMIEAQRNVGYKLTDENGYYNGMVLALDRGWKVAPTCGLDGHGLFAMQVKESSTKKPCRTGLLAPNLTATTVLDALKERRIYTTRDTNMKIKYAANNYWMGSDIPKTSVATFTISASDPDTTQPQDKITKIDVIGSGGKILASKTFSAHTASWQPKVAVGNNSYMFIRVFNGERTAHTAVAAPVWFK